MDKSTENIEKDEEVPEKLDYGKLPGEIEEIIEPVGEEIRKEVKISFDGRQYVVRFPKEISKLMSISTKDKIKFILKRPHPKEGGEPKLEIELIQK